MFEKLLRSILAMLLVGCPYVCGQCGVCAQGMPVVGANADGEAACLPPCCARHATANHSSDSRPLEQPGKCPCGDAGTCICNGAVIEQVVQEDRQPTIEHLYQIVTTPAVGNLPAAVVLDTHAAEFPPGNATSGRDVRTLCASLLL